MKLNPNRVLEIGPGPGIFKATSSLFGVIVETLDIDPDLSPDHIASALYMPFKDNSFDVVCAFQMLEHVPYDKSLMIFKEMTRVAKKGVVISLPDANRLLPVVAYLPKFGPTPLSIPFPRLWLKKHHFDGEHYWEVNKFGYSLRKVKSDFINIGWSLKRTFRVHENPYHRFFVFYNGLE